MPIENKVIENLASSLIREYLSRKGLKETLKTMDAELPRQELSINNRITLAREMHLEGLLKKNKCQEQPLSTMIEVIVKHIKETSRPRTRSSGRSLSFSEDKTLEKQFSNSRAVSIDQLIYREHNKSQINDSKNVIETITAENLENEVFTKVTKPVIDDSTSNNGNVDNDIETIELEDQLEHSSPTLSPRIQQQHDSTRQTPITLNIATALKEIIFGKGTGLFNYEWRIQSFLFSDVEGIQYGIVQKKGGPCGILAALQAFFLKHLLFTNPENQNIAKSQIANVTESMQQESLVLAIAETLWKAGNCRRSVVALLQSSVHFKGNSQFRLDQLTEKLTLHTVISLESLRKLIQENLSQFQNPKGNGCILYLYSLILSRTVEGVKEDMDDPNCKLMGAYNYCSQEIVNLIVTGKATSNTFDGIIELTGNEGDKCQLTGLKSQSQIGLLSLLEHYESCKVGNYFKSPEYPIWVVYSESHYSVVFSLNRKILDLSDVPKTFDLYYYDGLGNQDEEIRLTVDPYQQVTVNEKDLIPPLDLCIRTRWPGAAVNWNDTEPLL
ncbi:Protein FAM188B [Trichoplax sp. H2]|nr:Protein FAM188B [Trichoplax sp. H2]|eukprot:RDD45812.1 Protein FAM188B [Trichoplax sp. H2]